MILRSLFYYISCISGLLLLSLLAGCGPIHSAAGPPTPENPVVARVNGLEFTLAELERELAIDRATYQLNNGRELILQDLSSTLQGLIPTLLLAQQSREAGITADEAAVEAALADYLTGRSLTPAELEQALTTYGATMSDFRAYLARQVRIETYLAQTLPPEAEFHPWLVALRAEAEIELLYEPPAESPLVGSAAPAFEVTALSGETLSLAQVQGRPVILNFWASWCVPCKEEMPLLARAAAAHAAEGLVVIGLNYGEEAFLARPFIEAVGVTFPNGLDPGGVVTKAYGVTGLPTTVFINRQGVIHHVQLGQLTEPRLAEILAGIL